MKKLKDPITFDKETLCEEREIRTKKKDKKGNWIMKKIQIMTGTRVRCEVCNTPLKRADGQIVRFCSKKCKGSLNKNGRKAKMREMIKEEQRLKREKKHEV